MLFLLFTWLILVGILVCIINSCNQMSLNDFGDGRRMVRVMDDIILNSPNLQIGTNATYSPNNVQMGTIQLPAFGFPLNTEFEKIFRLQTTPTSAGAIVTNQWHLNLLRVNEHTLFDLEKTTTNPFTTVAGATITFPAATIPNGFQPNETYRGNFPVIDTATGFFYLTEMVVNTDGSIVISLLGAYGAAAGNFTNANPYSIGTHSGFYYCQQ